MVKQKIDLCNEQILDADIQIPTGALANIQYELEFYVNSAGTEHDTISLEATVAAVHSVDTSLTSDSQTGKFTQIVKFPLHIENTGNVRDTFILDVCNPNINSSCSSPAWNASFSNSQGNKISTITLDPAELMEIFADISVEDPFDNSPPDLSLEVSTSFVSESLVAFALSSNPPIVAVSMLRT